MNDTGRAVFYGEAYDGRSFTKVVFSMLFGEGFEVLWREEVHDHLNKPAKTFVLSIVLRSRFSLPS